MKLIQNRSGGRVRRSDDRCGWDTRDKMEPVESAASFFRAADGRSEAKEDIRQDGLRKSGVRPR